MTRAFICTVSGKRTKAVCGPCQEKDEIDGYKFLDSPDRMNLEVLVRSGTEFRIHPDQVKGIC